MHIRFTSALTSEDENKVAAEMLRLLGVVLDSTSLPYAIRVETSDGQIYRRSHPCTDGHPLAAAPERARQTFES